MKILIIHGPNLNMLGKRDPVQYGSVTLHQIETLLTAEAGKKHVALLFFQSNHEGDIIDFLQKEAAEADGILINPGALTHYGYSLRDALADTTLPVAEVHLSDINNREPFRKINVLEGIPVITVLGKKEHGYKEALDALLAHIGQ